MASPPPDHVIPSTEPASKPCGAKLILQEIVRKHFEVGTKELALMAHTSFNEVSKFIHSLSKFFL